MGANVDAGHLIIGSAPDLPFGPAGNPGAMCEPPHRIPDRPPVLDSLGRSLVPIFEPDLHPRAPEASAPIATRTMRYLNNCRVPSI